MKSISIANRKGGIGKSSLAINLSNELSYVGYNVLMIDLDSQCDLSKIYGNGVVQNTVYEVLKGDCEIEKAVTKVKDNLYLLAGSRDIVYWRDKDQEEKLKEELSSMSLMEDEQEVEIDFVIFDHPPTLNDATLAGFTASDYVLVVLEAEIFCVDNINDLLKDLNHIKKIMNSNLEVIGMVLNRVNKMRNLTDEVITKLEDTFSEELFEARISNDTAIPTSLKKGIPVRGLDWRSRTLTQFQQVSEELIERIGD